MSAVISNTPRFSMPRPPLCDALCCQGNTEKEKDRAEDNERRAVRSEDEALRRLTEVRRALHSAQVWRAAGQWDRDPGLALYLLDNADACPPPLRDFTWRLYRRLSEVERCRYEGHEQGVLDFDVSADGRKLASAGAD